MSRLILFAILVSSFIFINYYANPPDGYTGAPLNNEYSCSICHQTDINSPLGSSEVIGFPLKIVPGKIYDLNVNIDCADPTAKYSNFQLMIVEEDKSTGSFSNPSNYVKFSTYKDRTYAECKPATRIKNDFSSFGFSWKAPNLKDNTLINLYYTTIIANGDASFAGDRVIESKRVGIIGNSLDVDIIEIGNNICQNDSSGYAKIEVKGGQTPYSYLWSNGDTSRGIKNLKSGDYFVTVTDITGFKGVGFVKISDPDPLIFASITKIDATNSHKGSIEVEIKGGTGSYSYKWYKNDLVFSTEKDITNLDAACYRLIVEDSCRMTIDSTICIFEKSATHDTGYPDKIIFYPNPAFDHIIIETSTDDFYTIKIADSKGEIIKSVAASSIFRKIDLSGLSSGLYYLIKDYKSHKTVKSFVISK